jgi:hypothetical protein
MTSSGIETATFQIVAQCLEQPLKFGNVTDASEGSFSARDSKVTPGLKTAPHCHIKVPIPQVANKHNSCERDKEASVTVQH